MVSALFVGLHIVVIDNEGVVIRTYCIN